MFSYRHAFHAGNHADVLKHCILIHTLDYFKQKDKAFWVIDTHAGTGAYDLSGKWANQSGESNSGLNKILNSNHQPELVANYIKAIKAFNHGKQTNLYPGSPSLSYLSLRAQDKLFLFELLEAEHTDLVRLFSKKYQADANQVKITLADGFKAINALLPPAPRRGIILIDPSYENKEDYKFVIDTVKNGLKRFAQGCYLIWHPLVQRIQANELQRSLKNLPVSWLHATLTVKKPSTDGLGMHGSGMFIINPPWQLESQLNESLPWLCDALAKDNKANFTINSFEPKH